MPHPVPAILALEDEWLIPVPATLAKHFGRIGQFVVDLHAMAIRIMEVNALLAHMIYGPYHFDPLIFEREIGVFESLFAIDHEGDVMDTDTVGRDRHCSLGILNGGQIQRMAVLAQAHEHPAMLGVLLDHFKP